MHTKHKASPEKTKVLRGLDLLAQCSDRDLERVSRFVTEIAVDEGRVLTRKGDRAREVFVIVEGWASVHIDGVRVAVVGPGELLGEMAMLDGGPRTATAVADTPMRLLAISTSDFLNLIADHHVAHGIAQSLARRLRHADRALVDPRSP